MATKAELGKAYAKEVEDEVSQVYGFAIEWAVIFEIVKQIIECFKKTPEELTASIVEAKHPKKRERQMKRLRAQIRKAGPTLKASEVAAVAEVMVAKASHSLAGAVMA